MLTLSHLTGTLLARAFSGPIAVTLAYVLVYYLMIGQQVLTKTRLAREYEARGERFDRYFGNDREMLAADRYVGNMLEHMPAFLVLFWLNALFVGTRTTSLVGLAYVLSRLAYPFVMGRRLGRGIPTRILAATLVGYASLTYFAVRLASVALFS